MNNYTGGSALTTPFKGRVNRGCPNKREQHDLPKKDDPASDTIRRCSKGKKSSNGCKPSRNNKDSYQANLRGITEMDIDEIIEDEISSTKEEKSEKGAVRAAPTNSTKTTNE